MYYYLLIIVITSKYYILVSLSKLQEIVEEEARMLHSPWSHKELDLTQRLNNNTDVIVCIPC